MAFIIELMAFVPFVACVALSLCQSVFGIGFTSEYSY